MTYDELKRRILALDRDPPPSAVDAPLADPRS
jgi:hypothetical protein